MKIIMTKRKPGLYAQWFTVIGRDEAGNYAHFPISKESANTYPKAINYFKSNYKGCVGKILKNSDPL